jgi:hypothetical protein
MSGSVIADYMFCWSLLAGCLLRCHTLAMPVLQLAYNTYVNGAHCYHFRLKCMVLALQLRVCNPFHGVSEVISTQGLLG